MIAGKRWLVVLFLFAFGLSSHLAEAQQFRKGGNSDRNQGYTPEGSRSQSQPGLEQILGGVFQGVDQILRNAENQNQRRYYEDSYQPEYRPRPRTQPEYRPQPQPPRYVQPQPPRNVQPQRPRYVQPQPPRNTAPVASAPPKNIVDKRKPTANKLSLFQPSRASAELDARQANEAEEAGRRLEDSLFDEIDNGDGTEAEKDKRKAALADALRTKDPEKLRDYLEDNALDLSEDAKEMLDTRAELLGYQLDLESGTLTETAKKSRLAELEKKVDGLKGTARADMERALGKMETYNDLSEVATLVGNSDDSVHTFWTACEAAHMPATFCAEVTQLPIMAQTPVYDSTMRVEDICLLNPETNGETVGYNLGNYPYTMKPGERHPLAKSYVISFDPADGSGTKKYTLSTGTYEFRLNNNAWELNKTDPSIVIDNSQHTSRFNYLLNGKEQKLAAGETVTHSNATPMVLEFDRGDGGAPARKILTTGHFVVGIDPEEQRLDLFEDSQAEETGGNDLATNLSDDPPEPSGTKKGRLGKSGGSDKKKQIQEALARLKAKAG